MLLKAAARFRLISYVERVSIGEFLTNLERLVVGRPRRRRVALFRQHIAHERVRRSQHALSLCSRQRIGPDFLGKFPRLFE